MILVGNFFLNVSLLLYLFFYIPQIYHNFRHRQYNNLSLGFHALLLVAALADIIYGFGRIMQWQYRVISVVTLMCILIQHVQLFFYRRKVSQDKVILWLLSFVIIIFTYMGLTVFFAPGKASTLILCMGWVERFGYSFYAFPQWLKGIRENCLDSVSVLFLWIAVITSLCDTVSAWCLSWGPSSLYGAPVTLLFTSMLLTQYYYFKVKPPDGSGGCVIE